MEAGDPDEPFSRTSWPHRTAAIGSSCRAIASGADLEAQIPRLDPGETATLAFAVRTQTDIGARRTHAVNLATVDSETPDANPSNNRATVETVIDLP